MVSKEEVKHIAKLARLGLSEKEIEKMGKELSQILDYVNLLDELDVSETESVFEPNSLNNIMREDKTGKGGDPKKIIEQFPEKKGDFAKVKEILN